MAGNPFYRKSIISLEDLTNSGVEYIIDLALQMHRLEIERRRFAHKEKLTERVLVKCFYEDSTRTRSSHEQAALELGMKIKGFSSEEGTSSKNKQESLFHTLTTYQRFHGCVAVLRHPLEGSARAVDELINKSTESRLAMNIINGGDGPHEHPTQALLDFLTINMIRQNASKRFEELKPVFVGDHRYGRTVHSLAPLLARFGVQKMTFVNPEQLGLPEYLERRLHELGVEITVDTKLKTQFYDADFAYITRLQEERMPDKSELEGARKNLYVTELHIRDTPGYFRLLHPLPMNKENRGIEPSLDGHPKQGYFEQMENGVFLRKALLLLMLHEQQGETYDANEPPFVTNNWELNVPSFKQQIELGSEYKPKEGVLGTIEDGLVFDHVPLYMRRFIEDQLPRGVGTLAISATGLPSKKGLKDIVKTSNQVIANETLARIAAVVPGVTVSIIHNNRPVQKYKLGLPNIVDKVLTCPNVGCITRPEHHEHVLSKLRRLNESEYQCLYCDTISPLEDLTDPITRKYLPSPIEIEFAKQRRKQSA